MGPIICNGIIISLQIIYPSPHTIISVQFSSAKTCPGFPGYCSESFPGQTCVVVCSTGRNNVPLCQVINILMKPELYIFFQ